MAVVAGDGEGGASPVARFESLLDDFEAHAAFATCGSFGIEGVFNFDVQGFRGRLGDFQADPAAFGKGGDAVCDRVLNKRLKQERGNDAVEGFWSDLFLHVEAGTEADFLDSEKLVKQGQLFAKRDAGFLAKAESHTEEVRKRNAHFASARGVDRSKRADGVKAVEEEVGIDLGLEGAEFGVASQDAGGGFALLGLTRRFDG